jgi:dolichol-phosphate mannosyltransferase
VLKQPISDPMSGFFMLQRKVLDATVHGLSGLGFKILLDILATAKQPLRVAEVPYTFRNRFAGESKLDEMVIWEYGMLLADKTVGRFVPVRLLTFLIVGGLGVIVNLTILTVTMKIMMGSFAVAQHQAFMSANAIAIGLTMIFNFALNNLLTYRDRRLRGWKWLKGLVSFMLGCSIGGIVSFLIAKYLNEHRNMVYLASLAGVMVGSIWNYAVTQIYTWGKVK